MTRPRPVPPRPDLVRRPQRGFGWLDDVLLHERWLAELQPDAIAVLVQLALAADGCGASFYGRERMVGLLGIDLGRVDDALDRLRELGLIAHRPWRPGRRDGVWQLLPVPTRGSAPRIGRVVSAAEMLTRLGLRDLQEPR